MINRLCFWALPVSLFLLLCSGGRAQELSVMGGAMSTRDTHVSTYSWQLDYRQEITRFVAGSVAYINEGHIPNHHRDGTTFEGWLRLPLLRDEVALSAGAGWYYFYDTQPLSHVDSADVHGSAPIYSVSATAFLSGRWFVKGTLNRIAPRHEIKTTTALLGVGFWFGKERKPAKGTLGDAPAEDGYITGNEVTVFGGQSIVNTLFSQKAVAWAAEYRRGVFPHIDWTVSGIHEGDPRVVRRDGLATQGWLVNTFFDRRLCVGIGVGPYIYIDRRHPAGNTPWNPAAVAPLVSLSIGRRIAENWKIRAVFNRVTTNYNRDADVILVGLGYTWGGGRD